MATAQPDPMQVDEQVLDEDLHSRQIAVYGRDAMKSMAASKVLISGMNGLGAEIAKNVILAGVRAVTLHDTVAASLQDLSSQFYLTDADVGTNRADACVGRLAELNSSVSVSASSEPVTEAFLSQFKVVVFVNGTQEDLIKYDTFCHSKNIRFIKVESRGVFGNIFCDFGTGFVVSDVDGEQPLSGIIAAVDRDGDTALVSFIEDERIEFEDGMLVQFSEIKGMSQLNGGQGYRISDVNKKQKTFKIDLTGGSYSDYISGGICSSVKEPKSLDFRSLAECIADPGEFLIFDFAKFDVPAQLHVAFQALEGFRAANGGALPKSWDAADAKAVMTHATAANDKLAAGAKVEAIDEAVVTSLAGCARGDLCPMAAVLGGMAAQEVLKAVSGKFHPLHQWFYFDSRESLPDGLTSEQCAPTGSRYDAQIACLGQDMQRILCEQRMFLVGAGALGCEFLKNFALMGVACGETGTVTVTDDDKIEKSNLARQFLFRDHHIGHSKSSVAADAAKAINPSINVKALTDRVCPETETTFDDSFWENLTCVTNALDNVKARMYVDGRVVYFQRPLLESGTLGPKCNTQMVIPMLTENYGASRDPEEKQAPMCTLHSFPHNIDHCLTWARSEFEGLFEKAPSDANNYLLKPQWTQGLADQNPVEAQQTLQKVVDTLIKQRSTTFEECIKWARELFEDYNQNRIKQLTFAFGEDAVTSTGALFWSPPKRYPRPVAFDPKDPVSCQFITAAANLRAEIFGIQWPEWHRDTAKIGAIAAGIAVPEFVPKSGLKIETDPKAEASAAAAPAGDDVADDVRRMVAELDEAKPSLPQGWSMAPVEFEKDHDDNFHMDFITAAGNLRARIYSIDEVDKLQAKLIAGRIVPAIATATSLAAGLVMLELYKLCSKAPLEKYRNAFINLALPLVVLSEPVGPKETTFKELKWSVWDRWVVPGDPTLDQFLEWFEKEHGITASIISYKGALAFCPFMPAHMARKPLKLSQVALDVTKQTSFPSGSNFVDFVVACEDEDGEDVDVPTVSIRVPGR